VIDHTVDAAPFFGIFHQNWLINEIEREFSFFDRHIIDREGGYHELSVTGLPLSPDSIKITKSIQSTCRIIYCYCIARVLGRPGADLYIDHGIKFVFDSLFDARYGGFFQQVGDENTGAHRKDAYGHAFALLAGAAAAAIGHSDGKRLMEEARQRLFEFFWVPEQGAFLNSFDRDWSHHAAYNGQNANMHLVEALLVAYKYTKDPMLITAALNVADFFINKTSRNHDWQVIEHFSSDWTPDLNFEGDRIFKPSGTTPGHSMEWARLLILLDQSSPELVPWLREAAVKLFDAAWSSGWKKEGGGLYYTIGRDKLPRDRAILWWPCAESIAASAVLGRSFGYSRFFSSYRMLWDFCVEHFIDYENGGWKTQLHDANPVDAPLFAGKPDLYHTLQACLYGISDLPAPLTTVFPFFSA